MKVSVARGGSLSGGEDLTLQPEVLEQELIRQGLVESIPVYVSLGEILRKQIPENFIASIELADVVANLRQVGDFLLHRGDEVKVSLIPQATSGHYYLFCNAPDANHIFSSIQEYLHRRSIHFRVICHPMLLVSRRDGDLQQVAEVGPNLDRKSFVWMELDKLP